MNVHKSSVKKVGLGSELLKMRHNIGIRNIGAFHHDRTKLTGLLEAFTVAVHSRRFYL